MAIWVGTSGYNYPEWKGSFYPEKLPAAKMLPYYAERLSTVEIGGRFYHWQGHGGSARVCLWIICKCGSRCRPEIDSATSRAEMTPISSSDVTRTSWRDGAAKSGSQVPRRIADCVGAGGIALFE